MPVRPSGIATLRPAPMVGLDGVPMPPAGVNERIAAITGGRLSVAWTLGHRPGWGIRRTWAENDPRWEQVQRGQIPVTAAWDLEQMFPTDCPPGAMVSYVEANYGTRGIDAAKESEKAIEHALKNRKDVQTGAFDAFSHNSNERTVRESSHMKRVAGGFEKAHPMVNGGLSK